MEFQVLGAFRVVAEGRSLPLGGYKQRALLAVLLLERNRPVSPDRLVDALWGERPPASAANSVQVYVSRLRRTLASAGADADLVTNPAGYVLQARDDAVDAEQFERLLAEGSETLRAGEAARAEAILARALGLWRGPPLADFVLESFARNEITRLEELHLRAAAARVEALLALRRHGEILGELQALVGEHPLDEELRRHLMVALYRAGRPAEALATYRDVRRLLREELGLDPSRELRDLERGILHQDPALDGSVVATNASPDAGTPTRLIRARDERKMVTLLVTALDRVGGEQADPEDIGVIVGPYRHRLAEEVGRYGGTLVTALGEAVAAIFGAPSAHDDDAERAVRAALAIRDWTLATEAGQVRIGVEAGDALVSYDLGAPAEPILTGDVVGVVLRLQAFAPPGVVLVGSRAYGMTRDAIDFRPAGTNGGGESAWEAIRANDDDLADRALTPLVGRQRELAVLVSAVARVRETRTAECVTIIGEPGIGKSRLVHELAAVAAAEEGGEISWWQGRSIPYRGGVSFWALAQIVKAQAEILESDSSTAAAEKLAQLVAAVVGEREAAWVTRHLRPLLGLGGDRAGAPDRRDEAFAAWRRFFEACAEPRPLVLVFEDIHWADDGLLDFIDSLVEWLTTVPLLVLATARPELREHRFALEGASGTRTSLSLTALSDEDTGQLLGHLLAPGYLPPQTYADLLVKLGGNPLYTEQYARLVEEHAQTHELKVPDTVRATIAARIDALPAAEKGLVQSAAIFHKVFWAGAAAGVDATDRLAARAALHALERKQFVHRVPRSSVAGETEYAFHHVLLREVAYDQLPRAARAEKHERAAAWVESLGRSDDHAEMLAHHYVSALQLHRAAGQESDELAWRAYQSLAWAGERAFGLHAFDAATRHFERALELGPPDDQGRPHLLFRYASALYRSGDMRAREMLEAAREALLMADRSHLAAEADALLAEMWWNRAQRQRVDKHLSRAVRQLDERAPKETRASVLEAVARFRANTEEGEVAIRTAREALATAEQLDSPELTANILVTLGTARWKVGDRGGIKDVERALELAPDDAVTTLARAYINLANMAARDGDAARTEELCRAAQRAVDRSGDQNRIRFVRANTIYYNTFLGGDWDEALRLADEFIAECEAGSGGTLEHQVHSARAAICLGRGNVDAAVDEYRLALDLARGCDAGMSLGRQLADNAEAYVKLGQLQRARALADEVLRGGDTIRSYWAWNVFSLGVVADQLEITDALLALLGPADKDSFEERVLRHLLGKEFDVAADMMTVSGRRTREALLRLRAGQSLVDQGRHAEAEVQLDKAIIFYRSTRATRYTREAEALLAKINEAARSAEWPEPDSATVEPAKDGIGRS